MDNLQQLWQSKTAILLCAPPALYLMGSAAGQLVSVHRLSIRKAWSMAGIASSGALLFSLVAGIDSIFHAPSLVRGPQLFSLGAFGQCHLSFRLDTVETLMLLLVTFLGWVIVNYSRAYMAGDPEQPRYIHKLMLTLAAVSLLVVTNNLMLFLAAWVLTSLSLHSLLILYPDRQLAVIAAHKKFLASRLGDLALLSGFALIGSQTGSLEIDEVLHFSAGLHPISAPLHVAVVLLAISAMIKCAQLPLHGWLIQVMEAPTPVSALLHAGVVNLGGFMLIRLAPVINTTPAAQRLLVVAGCSTAVISSLVMITRISIKVHLAWSTCAQMGFMLMECGLGLYALALLHLLAHSLYKAHAFLGSGDTVHQAKLKRMMPRRPAPSIPIAIVGGCGGLLAATFGAHLWQPHPNMRADTLLCITIVGLATAGILTAVLTARSIVVSMMLSASAVGVSVLYFGCERLFQQVKPLALVAPPQKSVLMFAAAWFVMLNMVQIIIRAYPLGRFATVLYPWFYTGLYLDELFTRGTFRLWPASHISQAKRRRDATQPFEAKGVSL